MQFSDGFLALIATLMGASGLKVVEYLLSRSKAKAESDLSQRNELRADMDDLRQQVKDAEAKTVTVQAQVDEWRQKYYELMQRLIDIQAGKVE